MTYTYNLQTDIGKLRLLIQDTDVSAGADTAVFADEELQFCLDQSAGNLYLAAALALEINATDAARLAKRKQMDVLSTDTTQIAGQLRDSARLYREQAERQNKPLPSGTSLIDANRLAAALSGLQLSGTPQTEKEFAATFLPGGVGNGSVRR